MKRNTSILLYEKDKLLNSILIKQISYFEDYEIHLVDKNENLLKIANNELFDGCILNLKDFENSLNDFIDIFQNKNMHQNMVIYNHDEIAHSIACDANIFFLKKPFKITELLKYLKIFKYKEKGNKRDNIEIYLMDKLVFLASQKVIVNRITNKNEHLTEKETNLLMYLFQNKNSEISQKELLNSVWNINENINTHTIETHLYRLKQKLYNLEPKLTFSLVKQNGNYYLKN